MVRFLVSEVTLYGRSVLAPGHLGDTCVIDRLRDLTERGNTRAVDSHGTDTQSHTSPSILVLIQTSLVESRSVPVFLN